MGRRICFILAVKLPVCGGSRVKTPCENGVGEGLSSITAYSTGSSANRVSVCWVLGSYFGECMGQLPFLGKGGAIRNRKILVPHSFFFFSKLAASISMLL